MTEFEDLSKVLETYLDAEQLAQVQQAFELAKKAHAPQKRSSGEPYITHPVAVATILAKKHLDAEGIMAALLHDVIEDTEISKDVISERFGKNVAELVDGVSKLTQIKFESKAEAQAANFRKMMMAMSKDIRVILIKLADRLHNMRTLDHLPARKRHRIAKETLEIYAPIANRLGIRTFRDEFQERGFFCLYPLRYQVLKKSLRTARGNRREIISTIEEGLKQSLLNAGISEFKLYGREKNLYSIYKKMRDKHLHFSEVMDVYAFRIIVEGVDKCYRALGAVHNLYKPVPERFKDYIAIPKSNGYQSLHTTLFGPYGLPVEIQIRTTDMNKMAQEGIAAHWLYKAGNSDVVNQAQLRAREWIKGLMEIQQSSGDDSLEFIETVKIDLFPDEVYVFTPQGDIFELPHAASAVDFAYAVHSDIGNSCIAVKIDKRLVPLSTRLKSGQTIEVVTAPGARPNPAWLNFVVTGKARGNIRHFLKKQRREESIRLGQRLLSNSLKDCNSSLDKITEEQWALMLAATANCETQEDLLEAVGLGNQMAPIIARRLLRSQTAVAEIEQNKQNALTIKGTEGMALCFAKCCYPIPGDSVEGVLTSGRGIVVHDDQCLVIAEVRRKTPDKCIPVLWQDSLDKNFQVALTADLVNRRRSLALVATAIADAESNIEDISVSSQDGGHSRVQMIITVKGRAHLARVLRRLRQINTVRKVSRKKYSSEKRG
jgi:guanosine-3',5'-bis(diphosphate) 3'-pyrophosphohydrolase